MNIIIFNVVTNGINWQCFLFFIVILFSTFILHKWIIEGHFDNQTSLGGYDSDTAIFGIIGIIYRINHKRPYNYKIPRLHAKVILILGIFISIMGLFFEIKSYINNVDNLKKRNYSIVEGELLSKIINDQDLIFNIDSYEFRTRTFLSNISRILKDDKKFIIGNQYKIFYNNNDILKIVMIN